MKQQELRIYGQNLSLRTDFGSNIISVWGDFLVPGIHEKCDQKLPILKPMKQSVMVHKNPLRRFRLFFPPQTHMETHLKRSYSSRGRSHNQITVLYLFSCHDKRSQKTLTSEELNNECVRIKTALSFSHIKISWLRYVRYVLQLATNIFLYSCCN